MFNAVNILLKRVDSYNANNLSLHLPSQNLVYSKLNFLNASVHTIVGVDICLFKFKIVVVEVELIVFL